MIKLDVSGVEKQYAVQAIDKRKKLRKDIFASLFGIAQSDHGVNYRSALKGVSFTASQGESLAIIGKNGAGKSTLLKIIAGNIAADKGSLVVDGKVGGLIELGAGLDQVKTGRENARERAALIGVPDEGLTSFIQSIEDFSEIGEQFEDPVNTYSSGMKARLGFAISVSLPFDIMICDEALSVGDANFSAKCLAKVNELKSERIFLFVSHSMATVQRFCDSGIVLDQGEMVYSGDVSSAVAHYENEILNSSAPKTKNVDLGKSDLGAVVHKAKHSFLDPIINNSDKIESWSAQIENGENLDISWQFSLKNTNPEHQYRLGFPVFSLKGDVMFGCANEGILDANNIGQVSGRLSIPRHGLNPGLYQVVMALHEGMEPILRQHIGEIKVESCGTPCFGFYNVKHNWLIDEDWNANRVERES
jgi:ABC-type polysaccharide/polyol phosphate transport system ATPase subunit